MAPPGLSAWRGGLMHAPLVTWGALCSACQLPSLPTTPVPSVCTLLPVPRRGPPWALKGEARAAPLPRSWALSAGLRLNLGKKYTGKNHSLDPLVSPRCSPHRLTSSQALSVACGAVSALKSPKCPLQSYIPSSCLELSEPRSVPPVWDLCPLLQQRAQAINAPTSPARPRGGAATSETCVL